MVKQHQYNVVYWNVTLSDWALILYKAGTQKQSLLSLKANAL